MTNFVVCILICLITISQAHPAYIEDDGESESEIREQEIEDLARNIDAVIRQISSQTKDFKCVRHCIMKEINFLTPENKLNIDSILPFVKRITNNDQKMIESAIQASKICNEKVQDEDHCEAANNYAICFMEAMQNSNSGN